MKNIFLKLTLIKITLCFVYQLNAQDESMYLNRDSTLQISVYLETYFGYDFQEPVNKQRPDFLFNHVRHKEINLNIGVMKLGYKKDRIRANFGLMAGNYVSQNLVDEPPALRQIYEANIGVRLAAKQDLWLDVGVMESNLGFESVIGANCWMMTRSILAESSPYYLSAAKLNYQTRNEKWLFAFLFSNGWQRMVNGYPSLGHQVKWHPNKRWTINSSSFIGKVNISNNQTGFIPTVQQRYFHNFFFKYEAGRIGVIASLDAGLDHSENNTDKFSIWMGSALLLRYRFNTKFALAARGTLYSDNNSHNVVSKDFNDFMNFGFSLNLDHQITNNVLWRVEGKRFESRNPIYLYKGNPAHFNYYIGTALTFRIGEF